MKVLDVRINNMGMRQGEQWWEHVRNNSDEPLIHATITMTLSWAEYSALLEPPPAIQEAK